MANETKKSNEQDVPTISQELLSRIKISKPLAPDLFSSVAYDVVDSISNKKSESNKNEKEKINSSTQIRRFFNELVLWQDKVGFDEEQFKQAEPFIQMIRAKVAYAKSRKYVDVNFLEVMNRLIPQIKDTETLNNAKLFFEALIGFKKAFE